MAHRTLKQTTNVIVPPFDRRWALFLDVDGTLVDFVEHPERVKASPRLIDVVREVFRLSGGSVALVSGRAIASVDAIFEPLRLPIAGLHGQERRDAIGRTRRASAEAQLFIDVRERFRPVMARHPGMFIEEKGATIALHYRAAPGAAEDVEKLAEELEAQLPEPFRVQRGKMVVEILSCDRSKGTAIEAFMSEPPFTGRIPVFVGDDTTDEYGFRWVNEHDGISIKVGSGSSLARVRFEGVAQVVSWIEDYAVFLKNAEGAVGHDS
jgi:trehalose 6-phosphate phosphatase